MRKDTLKTLIVPILFALFTVLLTLAGEIKSSRAGVQFSPMTTITK